MRAAQIEQPGTTRYSPPVTRSLTLDGDRPWRSFFASASTSRMRNPKARKSVKEWCRNGAVFDRREDRVCRKLPARRQKRVFWFDLPRFSPNYLGSPATARREEGAGLGGAGLRRELGQALFNLDLPGFALIGFDGPASDALSGSRFWAEADIGAREGTPTAQKKVNPLGHLETLDFVRFFPLEKRLGAVN